MVQEMDTLNKNQSLPYRRWWHGLLFFLHQFMCLVLLLLLYHSRKSPSLIIICSFFSKFCTSSCSSCCSTKASWVSLDTAELSSGEIGMAIATYRSLRELIYHLFRTHLLRSIFDLLSSVSFKKLSSWCFNNAAMIVLLSVTGEHLSRYQAVPLTS